MQATLPNNALIVSTTPTATSVNGAVETFSLPDIPVGQSASVFITMSPLVESGSFIQIQAQVAANEFEPDATNNSATLLKVVSTPDQADLAVSLVGPAQWHHRCGRHHLHRHGCEQRSAPCGPRGSYGRCDRALPDHVDHAVTGNRLASEQHHHGAARQPGRRCQCDRHVRDSRRYRCRGVRARLGQSRRIRS